MDVPCEFPGSGGGVSGGEDGEESGDLCGSGDGGVVVWTVAISS